MKIPHYSTDTNPMYLAVAARGLTRIYQVGSVPVIGIDGIDLSISNGQLVVLKGGTAVRGKAPCCRCWRGWTDSPPVPCSWLAGT